MLKAIVCPTVRPDLFATFLRSLAATPALDEWLLYPVIQDWPSAGAAAVRAMPEWARVTQPVLVPHREAPYILRVKTMAMFPDVDVWANTDDDMEFLPGETDYSEAVTMATQPGVGVVSCNWIRSEAFRKRAHIEAGKFIRQPLVNMSGGQIYARRIAQVLARQPIRNYMMDDIHAAMGAYIAGYDNYRCLSSLLIHRILKPGGLQVMFDNELMAKPDPMLCKMVPAAKRTHVADNNFLMPTSDNLTARAHALHRANRAAALATP